jgi:hypothetical protein
VTAASWSSDKKLTMNRQILGMLSVAAGVSVFSVQDVIVKLLSGTYPVHQIVVVRSVVALPILLAVTLVEDSLTIANTVALTFTVPFFVALHGGKFRIHRLGLHALRGLILYVSYTTYYLALAWAFRFSANGSRCEAGSRSAPVSWPSS